MPPVRHLTHNTDEAPSHDAWHLSHDRKGTLVMLVAALEYEDSAFGVTLNRVPEGRLKIARRFNAGVAKHDWHASRRDA